MILELVAAVLAAPLAPQTVLTINPSHRIVEGVASDGRTIWVSSVLDRTIIACRRACRPLAVLPKGLHPFAIAWDESRQRLWVAAACPPGVRGIAACQRGALLALDRRGRIRARLAPASGPFQPGDIAASAGGVFASDSQNGAVYRLVGRDLAPLVGPGVGKSGQGMALDPTGKRLIVADYARGFAAVDLATGARTLLPRQDGKPLRGVDGLVRCGSTYYGIYNGAAPGALLSIAVSQRSLVFTEPFGDLSLHDPTQIALAGNRLLVVADSGWASLDKPGFKRTEGATVIAIPLSHDCKPRFAR